MKTHLAFSSLREANIARQKEWGGNHEADTAFRALEVSGEAGELAEAVKKLLRAERGIQGSTATLVDVASEAGDVVIALDLLCGHLGIDLGKAVAEKFDRTSKKYGLKTQLTHELAQGHEESFRHGFWWGFERAHTHPEATNIRAEYEGVRRLRQANAAHAARESE